MTSCHVATKPPTIFSIIKLILHFGLLIAFLALSVLALLDFLTYETTYRVSREERNISLPSFTLCSFNSAAKKGIFDKVKLAEEVMKDAEYFPIPITVQLLDEIEHQTLRIIDLKNSSDLQYYFDVDFKEVWTFACKSLYKSKDTCWPCITFNAPTFEAGRTFNEVSSSLHP